MSESTTDFQVHETMRIDAPPLEDQEPEPQQQQEDRPLTAREKAMIEIAANREKAINKELEQYEAYADESHDRATGQEIGTTQTERQQEAAQEQPEAVETKPAPVQVPQQPQAVQPPPDDRRVVNIGGQSFAVTAAEYDHLAQIGAIAQIALQQQQHPAVQGPLQPAGSPRPEAPHSSRAAAPSLDDETAKSHYRRLAFGSEEDGMKAIQDLYAAAAAHAPPQTDARAIQQAAVQEALQTIELNQNLAVIGQEYPEIFNDTVRSELAALQLHKLRQRNAMIGRQQDNLSLYREACNSVRSAISPNGQQPQPTERQVPTAPQAAIEPQRLERKRAAPRNPSSTAARATAIDAQPRAPTGSEVVEWMRKQRHQMPMR